MILSEGVLVKSPTVIWEGTTANWPGWTGIPLTGGYWASYGEIYARQTWVHTVINKLGMGEARLPYKVYERDDQNRPERPDHPYAQLMRQPHPTMPRFAWWLWVINTYDVYGEAFLLKVRDSGGRPTALAPLHPSCMHEDDVDDDGNVTWRFQNGRIRVDNIKHWDLIHPRTYNPSSFTRGMSRLEPLRRTLEFEDAAQRAQSSFWQRGARPGVALTHPGNLSKEAGDRLKIRWDEVAAGADKTGSTVVLEEGMKPEILSISADDAQYIDSRKLNREEVCAAYDVPPPAVHILDRATFSNITEQLRSLYRDTHAPRLKMFEDVFEAELRGSTRPGASEPDFGSDVYGEFLMDEVLRGDFEARTAAWAIGIQTGQVTPAEARKAENRPFIEGSDRLLVNAGISPLLTEQDGSSPMDLAAMIQKVYLGVGVVITDEEARDILNRAGANLTGPGPVPEPAAIPAQTTDERAYDPVVRRHLLGIQARLNELNGGPDA